MAKFVIEDNFFIIDSSNLNDVKTKLYGYCISEYSNYTDYLDNKINLNGLGAYIYIVVDNNKITIHQDYNGSYGLYLFQDKDYFALSNSFMYLVDYIKTKYTITLNKDYANYLLIGDLCSEIYEDTMINEIKCLGRNAYVVIDKVINSLEINYIDYKENTVEIGSDEFFDILDNWYYRWINIIRNLKMKTDNISTDLSGGMDSRCVLSLFLGSGIDLNTIRVNSANDTLSCHVEDFEIASQISNDYGFALNNNLHIEKSPFSLEDIINISFYVKLCFHKEMYFKHSRNCETLYRFCGSGGEVIRDYRDYWNFSNAFEFINNRQRRASLYPKEIRFDIVSSVEKIISKSFSAIREKFYFKQFDDSDLLTNLYRETRCRNHYGKAVVEDFLENMISLAPLLDSELQKLKLHSNQCKDRKSLLAIIFTRFAPNLLNYKFEANRHIDKETIEFAKKINNIKPFKKNNSNPKEYKIIKSFDLYSQSNNELSTNTKKDELSPFDFLLNIFHSSSFRSLFSIYFNPQIIDSIDVDIKNREFHPLRHAYAIIAITNIINNILLSEKVVNLTTIFDSLNNFYIESKDKKYYLFDFCDSLKSDLLSKNECIKQKDEQIKTKNEFIKQKDEQIKTKNEFIKQKDEQIKTKNEFIKQKDEQIKTKNECIKQKNNEIQKLHNQNKKMHTQNKKLHTQTNLQEQVIQRLQNSWSYRIGRLFTYPLSIPLDFYRYIRDYNLIKKSDLFDSEYYLTNNEDIKKAKIDPIKHYLKFGWKEGRNPSAEFNGNEYLNKRSDVRVAGICPLVHYIKFGKKK